MNFVLLWLECAAMLLLWIGLAISLEAQLPPSIRRWTSVAGLAGIAIAGLAELAGTLGIAILLKLSFAIGFVVSVAAVFFLGGGLLAFWGLRAEAPGLPPRARAWPWKRIALLLAAAAGLAGVSLHDMRISSEQELSRALADLRELDHQLDPPAPAALNAAPLYDAAWRHLVAMDQVPGARAALDAVEAATSPTRAQLLAAPLAEWEKQNQIALALLLEAARLPAYSTLEEIAFRIPPVNDQSRFAKVAELELQRPHPDAGVAGVPGHPTERSRAAHLLGLAALRAAAAGQLDRAVELTQALVVLTQEANHAAPSPEPIVEKLLATPGFTDAQLARLALRGGATLKVYLQHELIALELRDLEGMSFMQSGSWTQPAGRSSSLENAGTALLDLTRGFIDVLGTSELVARNRAAYDRLWEALYAPPAERPGKLKEASLAHRSWSFFVPDQRFDTLFADAAAREARRACAEVGIAVARYRLAQGHPPAALADLVPAYLLELPDDPFDGQPLRYRVEDGAALIYSVGPDLKDDAARPLLDADPRRPGATGDLVFRVDPQPR